MASEADLPTEFEPLLKLLQAQPQSVRELFQFAIVLMMIDDEKARLIGTSAEDGKTHWQIRTILGDEFRIVKPDVSEETEQMLLQQVRQILADDTNEEE